MLSPISMSICRPGLAQPAHSHNLSPPPAVSIDGGFVSAFPPSSRLLTQSRSLAARPVQNPLESRRTLPCHAAAPPCRPAVAGRLKGKGSYCGTVMDPEAARTVRESLDLTFHMSNILDTGLDRHTLSILIGLCDLGLNPEALAAVVKELRREPPVPVSAPSPPSLP